MLTLLGYRVSLSPGLLSALRDRMCVYPCSEQLTALFAILAAADSALAAHLRDIGAGECFFAYRMLVGCLACACHASSVHEV